jgi:NAD(P)H dehydrogenase (quinone)
MAKKVIIVYESKYGNTKLVAEKIAEGMREVEGTETVINEVKQVDLKKVPDYDAILVGSPNYIGGPTGDIKKSRSLSTNLASSI